MATGQHPIAPPLAEMQSSPRMAKALICCLAGAPTISGRVSGRKLRAVLCLTASTLTSTLLEHGLADEVLLFVYPVLLGKGKRVFAEGTPPRAFELASTNALSSGIVINAYKVAGPLKNQP